MALRIEPDPVVESLASSGIPQGNLDGFMLDDRPAINNQLRTGTDKGNLTV